MVYSGGTGANQDLKANRNLLGKRKKKKLSYVTSSSKVKLLKREMSPAETNLIRAKLKQRKKEEQRKLLFSFFGVLLLLFLISYLIDWRFLWDNFR